MSTLCRDRSTPLADEEYGGQQDVTSGLAYHQDDHTYLAFR